MLCSPAFIYKRKCFDSTDLGDAEAMTRFERTATLDAGFRARDHKGQEKSRRPRDCESFASLSTMRNQLAFGGSMFSRGWLTGAGYAVETHRLN